MREHWGLAAVHGREASAGGSEPGRPRVGTKTPWGSCTPRTVGLVVPATARSPQSPRSKAVVGGAACVAGAGVTRMGRDAGTAAWSRGGFWPRDSTRPDRGLRARGRGPPHLPRQQGADNLTRTTACRSTEFVDGGDVGLSCCGVHRPCGDGTCMCRATGVTGAAEVRTTDPKGSSLQLGASRRSRAS